MGPVAASRRSRSVEPRGDGSQTDVSYGSFSENVARLLDRIDYRRADTAEEREAIFRLRYQAYVRDGTITPNTAGTFHDYYDDTDNVHLYGLYVDGELASAIRIHVASREHPYCPTLEVFPEYLRPQLESVKSSSIRPGLSPTSGCRGSIAHCPMRRCACAVCAPGISRPTSCWRR